MELRSNENATSLRKLSPVATSLAIIGRDIRGVAAESEDCGNYDLFTVAMMAKSSPYSINKNGVFSRKKILLVATS